MFFVQPKNRLVMGFFFAEFNWFCDQIKVIIFLEKWKLPF